MMATVSWAAEAALPTLNFVSKFRSGSKFIEAPSHDEISEEQQPAAADLSQGSPPKQRSRSPSPTLRELAAMQDLPPSRYVSNSGNR